MLRVSEKSQVEMLVGGLAELLLKVADGDEAVFCMPGTENCFEPTAHYGIDGITEKVTSEKIDVGFCRWIRNLEVVTDDSSYLNPGLCPILKFMISDTVHDHFISDWRSNHLPILVERIGDPIPITITII